MPNLRDSFLSAQIKSLLTLCNQHYYARWKDTKLPMIRNPPIQTVQGNTDLRKLIRTNQNPWIKFQLRIWNSVKEEHDLQD